MELEKVIKDRRSIRKYKQQEVEDGQVHKLIEAARLCQSAKNRQPWRFMILRGEEKDMIAEIMLELFDKNNINVEGYINSSKYTAEVIKEASVLILALKEKDDIWITSDLLSMGAAIENVCLEAVNQGLGCLWIADTVYTEKEICSYIGYDELELVSAIAIGYADEQPAPRPRKTLDSIILKKS